MTAEADLLAAAAQHARNATIDGSDWLRRIRANPNYNYRQTEWYKALSALQQVKDLPAPTPPAGLSLQRTIFWANVEGDPLEPGQPFDPRTANPVQHACRLGNTWRHALTADPAYTPTVAQVNALKGSSAGVDCWANQVEIPNSVVGAFHDRWGLERAIRQGETIAEFDTAMRLSASYLIGNPNAWTSQQRVEATTAIHMDHLAVTAEVYNGQPDTYSAQGVPVSSLTLGVAMDGGLRYPLAGLLAKTPANLRSTVCIWHGSGLLPEDWAALADWTRL
jgi:hypothetical protein